MLSGLLFACKPNRPLTFFDACPISFLQKTRFIVNIVLDVSSGATKKELRAHRFDSDDTWKVQVWLLSERYDEIKYYRSDKLLFGWHQAKKTVVKLNVMVPLIVHLCSEQPQEHLQELFACNREPVQICSAPRPCVDGKDEQEEGMFKFVVRCRACHLCCIVFVANNPPTSYQSKNKPTPSLKN